MPRCVLRVLCGEKNKPMSDTTNIEPGIIARVSGALRAAYGAAKQAWFPPLAPLPQVAPQGTPTRQWDYPAGFNLQVQPRLNLFQQLRALADSYDLLRVVIETTKDRLARLQWTIRRKRVPGQRPNGAHDRDERIRQLTELFAYPDREHDFATWIRMLLEDMLVIDAATVLPVRTRGGSLYALELIDGATITPKIDYTGRTPQPPEIAYQQIVKGAPTVEYTRDELFYWPRNVRTHRVYGYSPVEQIVVLINLALRRELWLVDFYTEGTLPEAYLGVPDTWTPEQIKQGQEALDSYLKGNAHNRRKVILGPDGKLQLLKPEAASGDDKLDELIIRLICFTFSISPQALVSMMNRATAETAKDHAEEEGLAPIANWLSARLNWVIQKAAGYDDLEFAWRDERSEDPAEQAKILDTYVRNGILSINQARERIGEEPVEGGDVPMIYTASGPVVVSKSGAMR
jgi:HK97 family phage portal protein